MDPFRLDEHYLRSLSTIYHREISSYLGKTFEDADCEEQERIRGCLTASRIERTKRPLSCAGRAVLCSIVSRPVEPLVFTILATRSDGLLCIRDMANEGLRMLYCLPEVSLSHQDGICQALCFSNGLTLQPVGKLRSLPLTVEEYRLAEASCTRQQSLFDLLHVLKLTFAPRRLHIGVFEVSEGFSFSQVPTVELSRASHIELYRFRDSRRFGCQGLLAPELLFDRLHRQVAIRTSSRADYRIMVRLLTPMLGIRPSERLLDPHFSYRIGFLLLLGCLEGFDLPWYLKRSSSG